MITLKEIQKICSSSVSKAQVVSLLQSLQAQSVSDDDVVNSMKLVKQFLVQVKYNHLALLLDELKQIDTELVLLDSSETQLLKQQQQQLLAQQQELIENNKATGTLRAEIQELEVNIEALAQEIQKLEKELGDD